MKSILLCGLIFLSACGESGSTTDSYKHYFDLKGYFKSEAKKLSLQKPLIIKTVSQNNSAQQKHIKIEDWLTELELFTASDINKPSWRDSYKIIHGKNKIEYIAQDKKLRTQKILILKNATGEVKEIEIYNQANNALYNSTEKLMYFPDSVYSVNQHQKVLLIGSNSYFISGKFPN